MSQPFAFPPPPPPPPKPTQPNLTSPNQSYRGGRGRGGPRGGPSSHYGGHGRVPSRPHNYGRQGQGAQQGYGPRTSNLEQNTSQAHPAQAFYHQSNKRDHATAFRPNVPASSQTNHRPRAPPAVPSFGLDLESLLKRKPETPTTVPKQTTQKTNLLGLTPSLQAEESDTNDEDEDEETRFAHASSANILQFEHKGATSTLKTPEEIAAWIAERRKNFPTEAKREVALKEAETRRKKWEEEKAARAEAAKKASQERHDERQRQRANREKAQVRQKMLRSLINQPASKEPITTSQLEAERKADRLRRKAQKVTRQLEAAEAALTTTSHVTTENVDATSHQDEDIEVDLENLLKQVDDAAKAHTKLNGSHLEANVDLDDANGSIAPSDEDETSSSGTSSDGEADSDSDSSPEVISSKAEVASLSSNLNSNEKRFCRNLAKYGRCRFGKKCTFSHQRTDDAHSAAKEKTGPDHKDAAGKRKGLYQIMVEKEQEEERKKAVQVIIAMGQRGVFEGVS